MAHERMRLAALASVASLALATGASAGVFVDAASTYLANFGPVVSGHTIQISVMGQSDIYTPFATIMTPIGAPAYNMTGTAAAGWMPNGSRTVPGASSTIYGAAGPYANLGALVGTYLSNPQVQSDYFLIGAGGSFTPTQSGNLYLLVNDSFFGDNCGGFFVSNGPLTAGPQVNTVCASAPPNTSLAPIASLIGGHSYHFSASGFEFLGNGGPGVVTNPAGTAPQVNGYNSGQLLLSLVPQPDASQIIAVGPSGNYDFVASFDTTLYGWVNAATYPANLGGFQTLLIDVSPSIPEPMSLSLLLAGLGILGMGRYERKSR
jgi:hypothetical protein